MKTVLKEYTVRDISDGFIYNELEGKGLFGLSGRSPSSPNIRGTSSTRKAMGKKKRPKVILVLLADPLADSRTCALSPRRGHRCRGLPAPSSQRRSRSRFPRKKSGDFLGREERACENQIDQLAGPWGQVDGPLKDADHQEELIRENPLVVTDCVEWA